MSGPVVIDIPDDADRMFADDLGPDTPLGRAIGRPPPDRLPRRASVLITDDVIGAIKPFAAAEGVSVSGWVRRRVNEALTDRGAWTDPDPTPPHGTERPTQPSESN